jgi:hypothetical protein
MDTLSADGSFTYEKIKDSKDIITPVGPLIMTPNRNFDSSAYIYSGGVSWDFYRGLGVGLRGNYAKHSRTPETTSGVISACTGKWVTPVELRRYLVVVQRNFSANLLTAPQERLLNNELPIAFRRFTTF